MQPTARVIVTALRLMLAVSWIRHGEEHENVKYSGRLAASGHE
jgi:uncharacterized membrane protein YphA (DoxX/SURF4 family)